MKKQLMKYIKYFKGLRVIYRFFGNFLLKLLSAFVKTDEQLILFNSFGGKKFDDSPKAIYEEMLCDPRFDNYKFVWAFHEPQKFTIPRGQIIKSDTFKYFVTALKARCWITNSAIERGLDFKKKKTFYVNTWHGTPIKIMGIDEPNSKSAKVAKPRNYDLQNAQSEYEAKIFSRVFNIDYDKFLICGLPRNDILYANANTSREEYRDIIGIPKDKKVILYAPTFREYERDSHLNCILKPPIDFNLWKKTLGNDYVVLLRCHYEITQVFSIDIDGEFVIDVSDYPLINDLMLASDMLISDYSSIVFDYSILDRPIFLYTYDYEKYNEKRGMYFDIRDYFSGGSVTETELLELIKNTDDNTAKAQIEVFRSNYVTAYGNASKETVEAVFHRLTENHKEY